MIQTTPAPLPNMDDYDAFLRAKVAPMSEFGFEVTDADINPLVKPHQRDAIIWACRGGRRALFEAFGLGKSILKGRIGGRAGRRAGDGMTKVEAVDLFCGAGGMSSGLKAAAAELGFEVSLTGINHWDVAIATHSINHPDAKHLCTGIDQADPREVVPGGYLKLLVAAPECIHFSTARGGKPMSDQSRSSAMDILRWARELTIDNILIENVQEFRTWGPLHKCTCGLDQIADGVQSEIEKLEATLDLTKPPEKRRLSPEEEKQALDKIDELKKQLRHKPGFECHRPVKRLKGIFFHRFVRGLQALGYTVAWRILNAAHYGDATTRKRFFLQAKRTGKPITWPEPSHQPREMLKANHPDLGLVTKAKPFRTAREIIDWSIPGKSIFGRRKPLAANTIARIMAGLNKYSGLPFVISVGGPKAGPFSVEDPLNTVLTRDHMALAQPFLVILRNHYDAKSVDEPVPALAANGNHVGLCEPFIVPNFGEREGQSPRTHSVDEPVPAVTGHGAGCLVQPFVMALEHGGEVHDGRTRGVDSPLPTVTAKGQFGLVLPGLTPFVIGQQSQAQPRDVDQPIPTVAAAGAISLVEPKLEPFVVGVGGPSGKGRPQSVDDPLHTILAENHTGVCSPYLVNYHGGPLGDRRTHSVDAPVPTLDTSNRFGLAEPYLVQYNGTGGPQSVDDPIGTIPTHDRFGLVEPIIGQPIDVPEGHTLAWLDIQFRMLQPHELAAAMSFPKDYKFSGNREAIVKQIGNAVPVRLGAALCKEMLQ